MARVRAAAAMLLAMAMMTGGAVAETWPDRAVRIIVPFPPGGAAYVSPLLLAKAFTETLGQNFVLDPRPGGSTIIGTAAAASSRADGYTLFAGSNSAFTVNPVLYAGKLPYDAELAFEPIGMISQFPFFLCVPSARPIRTVQDLVADAKAHPGERNYASNGNGTVGNIAMEMLKRAAGIELTHVPYKAYIQALPDIVSGQINTMMCDLSVAGNAIQAGELRPLAVTTQERSGFLPDVPTMTEAGFPQVEAAVWIGLFAPAGTPAAIRDKLHAAMTKYLTTPQAAQDYKNIGQQPAVSSPDALRAQIKRETAKYGEIIRAAHIQAE